MALLSFRGAPDGAVLLLGFSVFCVITATIALIKGSRSRAVTSLVLAMPDGEVWLYYLGLSRSFVVHSDGKGRMGHNVGESQKRRVTSYQELRKATGCGQ
jgi:hypothetical protein